MKLRIILDDGARVPTRAHECDAGMDLYAREDKVVRARCSACFDTGVHIEIPAGYAGFIKSKSGLNVKHNLISDGVVDAEYQGSVCVKLYNLGETDYQIKAGDKISQLVIVPVNTPELELTDSFGAATNRGNGGFGSSGR